VYLSPQQLDALLNYIDAKAHEAFRLARGEHARKNLISEAREEVRQALLSPEDQE
jgi:hypothetical protein